MAFVTIGKYLNRTRDFRNAMHPSESNFAMLNRFQTQAANEQSVHSSSITHPEFAVEETISETQVTHTNQSVHQFLDNIQRKARRDKKVFWSFFVFFELFIFIPVILSSQLPIWQNHHLNQAVLAMLLVPPVGMALMALKFMLTKPKWNAEELISVGGVQAVGTLIDLLPAPKLPKQLAPLFSALTVLLPQMKTSDASLVNTTQRKQLYQLLQGAIFPGLSSQVLLNFRLAILKALEQIGDAAAIPVVTSIANGKARTEDQKILKAAALECLPLLREKTAAVEATNMLLRASSQEIAAPETLLRASEARADANPKELLRAANSAAIQPPP